MRNGRSVEAWSDKSKRRGCPVRDRTANVQIRVDTDSLHSEGQQRADSLGEVKERDDRSATIADGRTVLYDPRLSYLCHHLPRHRRWTIE